MLTIMLTDNANTGVYFVNAEEMMLLPWADGRTLTRQVWWPFAHNDSRILLRKAEFTNSQSQANSHVHGTLYSTYTEDKAIICFSMILHSYEGAWLSIVIFHPLFIKRGLYAMQASSVIPSLFYSLELAVSCSVSLPNGSSFHLSLKVLDSLKFSC